MKKHILSLLAILLALHFPMAIAAHATTDDPRNCQESYNLWINGSDEFVSDRAAFALILGNCRDKIKRKKIEGVDPNVDSKCCKEAQKLIKLIEQHPTKKEFKEYYHYEDFKTDLSCGGKGEAPITSWIAMNLIFDWYDSVSRFEGAQKDWGSLEENKKHYLAEILTYWVKEERAIHICPNLEFPDFKLWNQIIQNSPK